MILHSIIKESTPYDPNVGITECLEKSIFTRDFAVENADCPIDVTELGIRILLIDVQFLNA